MAKDAVSSLIHACLDGRVQKEFIVTTLLKYSEPSGAAKNEAINAKITLVTL